MKFDLQDFPDQSTHQMWEIFSKQMIDSWDASKDEVSQLKGTIPLEEEIQVLTIGLTYPGLATIIDRYPYLDRTNLLSIILLGLHHSVNKAFEKDVI